MVEVDEKASPTSRLSNSDEDGHIAIDTVSPGVARIEATVEHLTSANQACIFFGVLLIAWAYGLDSILRVAYQPIAVSALNAHSFSQQ